MHRLRAVRVFIGTLVVVTALTTAVAQIRRAPGEATAQVPVSVELKIGSDLYKTAGPGACTHATQAAIYNVRSQLRTVRFTSSGRSVQLTFWDPLDGSGDMFSLATTVDTTSRTVSTVRGGQRAGSGTVTFEPAGKGGAFKIDAKTADGTHVTGTIKCDAFTPHVAEGG